MKGIKRIIRKNNSIYSSLRKLKVWLEYLRYGELSFKCFLRQDYSIFDFKNISNKNHFFGYYDKTPWSDDMGFYLSQTQKGTVLDIVVFDLKSNKLIQVGQSISFNFQQGAMAQWYLNEKKENIVLYNSVIHKNLSTVFFNLKTKEEFSIKYPIQSLNKNKKVFYSINYLRLQRLRKEYGYDVLVDNFSEETIDSEDGIWMVRLEKDSIGTLIISLDRLKDEFFYKNMNELNNKINHIFTSPNGEFFIFMHRWFAEGIKYSRLYLSSWDGAKVYQLLGDEFVSHYSWMDNEKIVVFGMHQGKKGYFIIDISKLDKIRIEELSEKLSSFGDGHPSISPNKKYLLTDTYPSKGRKRKLILFNLKTKEIIEIGQFFAPLRFDKETRVDLHPRWSPNGKFISIDSAHNGKRDNFIISSEIF